MFLYESKLPYEVRINRPDFRYYELLDRQLSGCEDGCVQAATYIRQGFMIHNREFHDIYMRLGAKLFSDMEILADVLHQMHGEDDRYYDESNDDTPDFELIKPLVKTNEDKTAKHHVNNDLTACVMRDMAYEQNRMECYESIINYIDDDGADQAFQYLINHAQQAYDTLKNILTILTTHTEMKDFGLAGSHNEFDLDTSNYFDKPNPTFLNPNEIQEFHKK